MDKIIGKITVVAIEDGSKSQGNVAYIDCDNSKRRYTIYRAGMMSQNDDFLCSLDGKRVILYGSIEEKGSFFCVESLTSENGNNIQIPTMVLSELGESIFIKNNLVEKCSEKPRRIPRKLKKKIKKQKK